MGESLWILGQNELLMLQLFCGLVPAVSKCTKQASRWVGGQVLIAFTLQLDEKAVAGEIKWFIDFVGAYKVIYA